MSTPHTQRHFCLALTPSKLNSAGAFALAMLALAVSTWGVSLGHSVCSTMFAILPLMVALHAGPKPFLWTLSFASLAPLASVLLCPNGYHELEIVVAVIVGVALCVTLLTMVRSLHLLKRDANTDPLTGVWNRRGLAEQLAKLLPALRSAEEPVAVLSIDIDHFKGLNDTLGHDAGDNVLRILGGVLRDPALIGCTAARIGGDEFMIFVPEQGQPEARQLAANLKTEADRRFKRAGYQSTVSVGLAWFSLVPATESELMKAADEALYAEKEARTRNAELLRRVS